MTIDVDHLHQKIADIHADCRCKFELAWAPDFALESRSGFAVGAVGHAVSG
jgi:hypothetical protein